MKKYVLVGVLVLGLVMPVVASAAVFYGGDSYSLPKGQTVAQDLYIGTGSGTIAGDVAGDVIMAGGSLVVSGNILGDIWVAGGNIAVSGTVRDDVRAAGGTVTISGPVVGDVLVAGGQVHIVSGASVGGDVVAAGGQITIDGPVGGNVRAAGGKVTINSTVNGKVDAAGDRVTLGSSAVIRGLFSYRSSNEATVMTGAQLLGGVDYKAIPKRNFKPALAAVFGVLALAKLVIMFIAAVIFTKVFPKHSHAVITHAAKNFWPSVLVGLLLAIALPIASVVFLVTVVGIPFGILGFLTLGSFMVLSGILVSPVLGSMLYRWMFKGSEHEINWKTILIGVVVLGILRFVPIVGWLASCIFVLATVGSVGYFWRNTIWNTRKSNSA